MTCDKCLQEKIDQLAGALQDLVTLKEYRDWHGKMPEYLEKKLLVWHQAHDVLQTVGDSAHNKRLELKEGRKHLTVTNEFQSDKYPWCPAGFVPLKITDLMARDSLWNYAQRRRVVDSEFSRDLEDALLFVRNNVSEQAEPHKLEECLHGISIHKSCDRCRKQAIRAGSSEDNSDRYFKPQTVDDISDE